MEGNEFLRNKWVQTTAISIVTFAAGAGLGYILAKRKLKKLQVAKEIDEAIEEANSVMAEMDKSRRERLAAALSTVRAPELGINEPGGYDESEVDGMKQINIYRVEDDDWDYETELSTRTREEPYVIHRDEFFGNEMDFQQETLTYYAGDDIMSDTDDSPIYNYQGLMGVLQFGHGSGDPNVCYIRNEVIHMEWELLLNHGTFAEEVLGLEMEKDAEEDLKHSILKFRRD